MKNKSASRIDGAGLVILVLLLSVGPARATVRFWTGSSASWNTDSAWNPAGVPVTGDDLVFPVGITTNLTSTMDLPGVPVFDEISMHSSGYVINPSGSIGRSFGVRVLIEDTSPSGGNVINAPIVLSSASGTVEINATVGPLVFGGALSGSAGVTLTGAGIVRFIPTGNSYSGETRIHEGILEVSRILSLNPSVTIPGALEVGDGTGEANSDIVRLLGSNMIANDSNVFIRTSGLLDLNNFDEGIGGLTGPGNVDLGSGTLTLAPNPFFISIFSGVITGSGSLVKTGEGGCQLTGTASNTYGGSTTVLNGFLILGHTGGSLAVPGDIELGTTGSGGAVGELRLFTENDNIANTSNVTVLTTGLFNVNGFAETIGTLNGDGNVSLGSGTLTIEPGILTSGTFSGIISGIGSIAKQGRGQLFLDGTNSYSGPTVVADGILLINGLQPDSEVVLAGGVLAGTGHTGPISAGSSSLIRPGPTHPNSVGRLRTGNLSLGGASVSLQFNLNGPIPGTDHDQLDVIGTVELGSTTSFLILDSVAVDLPRGTVFTLIENDLADAVAGQFSGRPEGSALRSFNSLFGITTELTVSYVGGTGNDVTLTFRGKVGDVNGDDGIDTVDIFTMLQFLFGDGPTPIGVADMDGNGAINVLDLFRLINLVF